MLYSQDLVGMKRLSLHLDNLVELVSTLLHQFVDMILFHLVLDYLTIPR
jgi:hypothetical protein